MWQRGIIPAIVLFIMRLSALWKGTDCSKCTLCTVGKDGAQLEICVFVLYFFKRAGFPGLLKITWHCGFYITLFTGYGNIFLKFSTIRLHFPSTMKHVRVCIYSCGNCTLVYVCFCAKCLSFNFLYKPKERRRRSVFVSDRRKMHLFYSWSCTFYTEFWNRVYTDVQL